MKKIFLALSFIFVFSLVFAQRIPTLKANKTALGLYSLDIKVDVIGNRATTTYDMLFYNPTSSVLEGELSFPLGEGHEVSRFALEINGKLREAVVVEKELGRIAFEAVVRRRVDPALLEKGTGNNYKARIYPIPAKGYKRIVLAYEQELTFDRGAHFYNLPLNFKNSLHNFSLRMDVFDQKSKPVVTKGRISGLEFKNWNKNYTTTVQKRNYVANTPLRIKIPLPVYTEKVVRFKDVFYVYKTFDPRNKARPKPRTIALYWDVSLSMKDRDIEKEFAFLEAYINNIKNVEIRLISFSNTLVSEAKFDINNGNWSRLKAHLNASTYDGGTSYKDLFVRNNETDIKLLFSDGLCTLSDLKLQTKTPLFIINSLTKSNHAALKVNAEATNGAYINLQTASVEKALRLMQEEAYRFLGFTSTDPEIELYPKAPMPIISDFSIAGRSLRKDVQLELHFGYGTQILERIPVKISLDTEESPGAKRLFAQKKLAFLEIHTKKNKKEIIALSKANSLVSKYTSLIVLDDIRDYVRYQITPPKELLPEYNRLLALQRETEKRSSKKLMAFMSNDSESTVSDRARRVSERNQQFIIPSLPENKETPDWSPQNSAVQMNRMVPRPEVIADEIMVEEMVVEAEEVTENIPFMMIEEPPVFPGCKGSLTAKKRCFTESMRKHVQEHFNENLANTIGLSSGRHRIYAQFTVNRTGNVTRVRVVAPHSILETEAKRVLRLLPRMIPGRQRNRPVTVKYVLPIVFNVEGANNKRISIGEPTMTAGDEIRSYKRYKGDLTIKERTLKTDYINELSKATSVEEGYAMYLKQRSKHKKTSAYFVDVAGYFLNHFESKVLFDRIISNIPEVDFDNYELLKVFAYQLVINKDLELAVFINQRILELRPEDAQSYRDLALAYEAVGKCQEAFDVFNDIISGKIYENNERRVFRSIEKIARNEVRHLIAKYRDDLDLKKVDPSLLEDAGYDIRILVDWNHNDTDIDLHVIDPNLEECFYGHRATSIHGSISEDMTQGFGPEEFTLTNAIKGNYYIKVKYYGDRYQKVENPTFMKVTICKNYGRANEDRETKLIRLTKKDDEEMIAKLTF